MLQGIASIPRNRLHGGARRDNVGGLPKSAILNTAMAKRYAVDACDRAIALAMRIHGAMGLGRDVGLEQLARDVRTMSIADGTPGILTLIQGRERTGIDPFR